MAGIIEREAGAFHGLGDADSLAVAGHEIPWRVGVLAPGQDCAAFSEPATVSVNVTQMANLDYSIVFKLESSNKVVWGGFHEVCAQSPTPDMVEVFSGIGGPESGIAETFMLGWLVVSGIAYLPPGALACMDPCPLNATDFTKLNTTAAMQDLSPVPMSMFPRFVSVGAPDDDVNWARNF